MAFDDFLAKGQADAGAGAGVRRVTMHALKDDKNAFEVLRFDALPAGGRQPMAMFQRGVHRELYD